MATYWVIWYEGRRPDGKRIELEDGGQYKSKEDAELEIPNLRAEIYKNFEYPNFDPLKHGQIRVSKIEI